MPKNRRYSWNAALIGQSGDETSIEVAKPPKAMTPGRARRWAARAALRLIRDADPKWYGACAVIRSCKSRGTRLANAIVYDDGPGLFYLTGARLGGRAHPRRIALAAKQAPQGDLFAVSATPPLPDPGNPPNEGP